MHSKNEVIELFSDIMYKGSGICGFVSENSSQFLFSVLGGIEKTPLTKVQFDQLLALQNIKTMSYDFFEYYWLNEPEKHFCQTQKIVLNLEKREILSLEQLKWGFNRLFIDCLFVFGNIQRGYDEMCNMSKDELVERFRRYIFDTQRIISRGNTLHFENIDKEDRYLISEMACKTYANIGDEGDLAEMLRKSYREAVKNGIKNPTFRSLLDGKYYQKTEYEQTMLYPEYVLDDNIDDSIKSEDEITKKAKDLARRFTEAHNKALKNTELYLSLVRDLDVYVATSMRKKEDFIKMATFCERVFKSEALAAYDLRYFDPTISAAESHEDKGLLECLMVKSARMLIYNTGGKDSYGKDVEAAMALCLGKPTIFFCSNEEKRADFFRNIHPLSRLVNFKNGVAGGVIVCISENEVIEIIHRIITNNMSYSIVRKTPDPECGYYLLKESLTQSVVRVQTNDELLASAFWNNYLEKNKS